MNMPERNVALTWVGRTVVDRDGAEIGACTAVFADDATELAEWVCSEFDGGTVFIPAVGAAESDGMVQVVISREDVAGAPAVGGPEHISGDEEAALYRHYGIPHSRDNSPTVLPTEDAVLPGDQPATTPDTATPADTTDWADTTDRADSTAEPESTPAADYSTATPDRTTAPAAPGPVSDHEDAVSQPSSARRRVALAVSGATALAGVAGAVLGARRRRKQTPATRIQRLTTPVVKATTQVARQRRTGVAVATSALAAALLAAKRRRSSRPDLSASQDVPSTSGTDLHASQDVPTTSRNDLSASPDVHRD